jgi:predicted  nucleic acid-binding Zn-ribbon protein
MRQDLIELESKILDARNQMRKLQDDINKIYDQATKEIDNFRATFDGVYGVDDELIEKLQDFYLLIEL